MISGVVLARNEEANIAECLSALRPHVEELLLIDMESSDRTVEFARPFVDGVLFHPLIPAFDAARNLAIHYARHEWLWFVDADERVSHRTAGLVRRLLQEHGGEFDSIVIPFKSYFCGQWMQHCGWWPGYTMPRVLKRGTFRFAERLHGGVESTGRQVRLPPDPAIGVDHFSYRSVEHYLEKLNRYTSTESRQLAADGAQWDWRDALRDMVRDLWVYYELNPGKLDRERGWILSWLSGQYRWVARAKLIDNDAQDPMKPPVPGGAAPENLDEVADLWQRELARLRVQHPVLPLGVLWKSPLFDYSGYADEGRAFVKALAEGDRPLRTEELRWNDRMADIAPSDSLLIRTLARVVRPPHVAAITDCIPTLVEPDPHAALNILRTTFETDRIPDSWHTHLGQFDEIWVPSQHNARAFRRSGVAPEKVRVVPSCFDSETYRPTGARLELPPELRGRFVFLSVFDWQLRKGWDVLLRAYVQEFPTPESVGLLLKITRQHGHTWPLIRAQIEAVLTEVGQSLGERPDIVVRDDALSASEMGTLYRAASAFILPSRGEGWGRPCMEAMACGLPVVVTKHLGCDEFCTPDNAVMIEADLVSVPEEAAREIPPYRDHRWYEPQLPSLRQAMRQVFQDEDLRASLRSICTTSVPKRYDLRAGRESIERALGECERKLQRIAPAPPQPGQLRVVLEGEFFAQHSFANVNEQLALRLAGHPQVALSLSRVQNQLTFDSQIPHAWKLRPFFERQLGGGPSFTIRHAFPPNWQPVPAERLWIHVQPWEFGHLPVDWIAPLRDRVDEIWVPSNYVKRVYVQSGIATDKVHTIPWGIDPEIFNPGAEPRLLPTSKSFRFLYVGGLIGRKGFDLVLQAYLQEFGPQEDVCLVVKDLGSDSFYRFGNFQADVLIARENPSSPSIVYFDQRMTPGQLASLYTACHSFVAPYRAEGFGLPILEAMACGLAPIVSAGGASADFASSEVAYLVPATEADTTHDWQLTGPPRHLEVQVSDVRRAMRTAFDERERTRQLGAEAALSARNLTWQRTTERMVHRLQVLSRSTALRSSGASPAAPVPPENPPALAACVVAQDAERALPFTLAQLVPHFDETIVIIPRLRDRSALIAKEYGAKVILLENADESQLIHAAHEAMGASWYCWVDIGDRLVDLEGTRLREVVAKQPWSVHEVILDLPKSRLASTPLRPDGKVRLMRRSSAAGAAAC